MSAPLHRSLIADSISLGLARIRRYHRPMAPLPARGRLSPLWRAVVEVAFIVFLFYSNLLMGEFTATSGKGKTLVFALHDIATPANFAIGLISALIGYVVFEFLRRKL
jgi:hypothetical protein